MPPISQISTLLPNSTETQFDSTPILYGWLFECHGFWHNISLIIPSLLFVLYLGIQAKKSYLNLSHGRSSIIVSYYISLWIVSLLNLAWCSLQLLMLAKRPAFLRFGEVHLEYTLSYTIFSSVAVVWALAWECNPKREVAWNILSLLTKTGMLFLEVSLLAFLLQGNYANGPEALIRTFSVSACIVVIDIVLKTIYIMALGVPLFIDIDEPAHPLKWVLWVVHKLILTAVYGIIFFMYHSRWRERLAARPAFYRYTTIMFALNAIALLACALTGNGAWFGLWLNNATIISYHAFYLPLLYITFLADFFQEDDMNLESVYYSEMKDAGFFDADWE